MVTNNKVLTVSYGTFSCTLEGFDDSFEAMKAIAEYFRDLAADDRYFGAEPPTPDADMLARIAEREVDRRVEARHDQGTLVLTAGETLTRDEAPEPLAEAPAPVDTHVDEEDVSETVAINEDQLAEERGAFFESVESSAQDHAMDVAEDVAEHEAEQVEEETPATEAVEPMVLKTSDLVAEDDAFADDDDDFEDDLAADSEEEEVAELLVQNGDATAKAREFFAGTEAQRDAGVSNIAAKLSRIRAVVAKAEQEESDYSEDEHAENPAADFLRKSASDIEGSLEDEDHEVDPQTRSGRVIRMRNTDIVDAEEDVTFDEIAEDPITYVKPAFSDVEIEDEADAEDETDAVRSEFEEGYNTVGMDDDSFEDEAVTEEEEPRPMLKRRPKQNLSEEAPQDDAVDRLMSEANSKLDEPEMNRRRTTLAHLRAAVAATRAEETSGIPQKKVDQSEAYREDLADVMRPRRAATEEAPASQDDSSSAPLRLVASQRIETDATETEAEAEPAVRPRRVSPSEISAFEAKEETDFVEFAETMGATQLPDIMEAAASYLTYVEGRRRFSRPMLMRLAYQLGPERFQREAGLRAFGQLLRDKKIEKIAGGRFTAAETIRFKPEERAAM